MKYQCFECKKSLVANTWILKWREKQNSLLVYSYVFYIYIYVCIFTSRWSLSKLIVHLVLSLKLKWSSLNLLILALFLFSNNERYIFFKVTTEVLNEICYSSVDYYMNWKLFLNETIETCSNCFWSSVWKCVVNLQSLTCQNSTKDIERK